MNNVYTIPPLTVDNKKRTLSEAAFQEGGILMNASMELRFQFYLKNKVAFAIALHEALGWDLVALMKEDDVIHVALINPKGDYLDARGMVTKEEIYEILGDNFPYNLKLMKPEEIRTLEKDLNQELFPAAVNLAKTAWPLLPWKK